MVPGEVLRKMEPSAMGLLNTNNEISRNHADSRASISPPQPVLGCKFSVCRFAPAQNAGEHT
jgi:hypothetical protein